MVNRRPVTGVQLWPTQLNCSLDIKYQSTESATERVRKSAAQSSRQRWHADGRRRMFNGVEAPLGNAILVGLGLSSLGSAIANITLPNISRSFASSGAATVWVVNAYQLSATICLLPVASLAE